MNVGDFSYGVLSPIAIECIKKRRKIYGHPKMKLQLKFFHYSLQGSIVKSIQELGLMNGDLSILNMVQIKYDILKYNLNFCAFV